MHAGASCVGRANGAHTPNHDINKTRGRTTALPRQPKTGNENEVMNAPPHPRDGRSS